MGNSVSSVPDVFPKGEISVCPSLSVCLACHKNYDEYLDLLALQHRGANNYAKNTEITKRYIREFLESVYNVDSSTDISWVTLDQSNADIVVAQEAVWVEDGGFLVPEHMRGRSNEFDVVVSVFCPIGNMPNRDVAFAYKLLKKHGIFILVGVGTPEVWSGMTGRREMWGHDPIDGALPSPPLLLYFHDGGHSRDRFSVYMKV